MNACKTNVLTPVLSLQSIQVDIFHVMPHGILHMESKQSATPTGKESLWKSVKKA